MLVSVTIADITLKYFLKKLTVNGKLMKTNQPVLPLNIKSNQYMFPCKTYYYITDANGLTYHYSDNKWRKKSLIEMRTHCYYNQESVKADYQKLLIQLTTI